MSTWDIEDELDLQDKFRVLDAIIKCQVESTLNEIQSEENKVMPVYRVSTENDCEGRSLRDLGVWQGSIEDIALYLANKCYYSLTFEECEIQTPKEPTRNKVDITLRGGLKMDKNTKYYCKVHKGLIGDNVKITMDHEGEQELIRRQALEKLSSEEREALGIK